MKKIPATRQPARTTRTLRTTLVPGLAARRNAGYASDLVLMIAAVKDRYEDKKAMLKRQLSWRADVVQRGGRREGLERKVRCCGVLDEMNWCGGGTVQ